MSITLYSKYRRQNLRNAWKLSNMDKTMLYVYAGIAALLTAYMFVAWIEMTVEEAEQAGRKHSQQEIERLKKTSALFAAAMNGGAVVDAANNTAYFFQVSEQKGL
jgi:hypothetical protein